jgi:hypothetical protein
VNELKTISKASVAHCLEKAERYRLLNDPEQSESICHDVLAVDPDNLAAKRILILAITDQFTTGAAARVKEARQLCQKLADPYERSYFLGIVSEREGRGYLARGLPGSFAFECFHDAMDCFQAAEGMRPTDNDDAILRWNSCLRSVRAGNLKPRHDDAEQPLE